MIDFLKMLGTLVAALAAIKFIGWLASVVPVWFCVIVLGFMLSSFLLCEIANNEK